MSLWSASHRKPCSDYFLIISLPVYFWQAHLLKIDTASKRRLDSPTHSLIVTWLWSLQMILCITESLSRRWMLCRAILTAWKMRRQIYRQSWITWLKNKCTTAWQKEYLVLVQLLVRKWCWKFVLYLVRDMQNFCTQNIWMSSVVDQLSHWGFMKRICLSALILVCHSTNERNKINVFSAAHRLVICWCNCELVLTTGF